MLCYEIHEIIYCILNKEEIALQREESIIVLVYKRAMKLSVVVIEQHHCSSYT
jgi:hypothetical protein